jgi:hypothetical protein
MATHCPALHSRHVPQVSLHYIRAHDTNLCEYALTRLRRALRAAGPALLHALLSTPVAPASHVHLLYTAHLESIGAGMCPGL